MPKRGGDTPAGPHEDFSFEELSSNYNFQRTYDWAGLFVRLVVDELNAIEHPPTVVDIGCGSGIGGSLERLCVVRQAAGELWGVEPDESVQEPPGIFDTLRRTALATAGLPDGLFDVAYSFMVMEHVIDPEGFLRSVHASLRRESWINSPPGQVSSGQSTYSSRRTARSIACQGRCTQCGGPRSGSDRLFGDLSCF